MAEEADDFFMNEEEIDEFFEHFGVRGMQWGVRRDTRDLATAARLRRVEAGTASKGDIYDTFIGLGRRGGFGGIAGIKTAGKGAANIEARVAKRQASRAANAEKAASKASAKAAAKEAAETEPFKLTPAARKALTVAAAATIVAGSSFVAWKVGSSAGTSLRNITDSRSTSIGQGLVEAYLKNAG